ncbi:hypothetical protein Y032_0127g1400 [Ancylostoma ceylanicum]|uniref:Uncharacterized protein n=1 Tax=Ancylostoma ceylanicum TaxID=53326 RepID=A0A016T8B2_9BILA|nr:hypothetical protein Y032_0127g1400 [Ancylostoma ceylanicum]
MELVVIHMFAFCAELNIFPPLTFTYCQIVQDFSGTSYPKRSCNPQRVQMTIWDEITSIRPEHLLPVCLLFVIFFIFLIACLCDCWREKHIEDLSVPNPPSIPRVTVTNGKTGEEREVPAQN